LDARGGTMYDLDYIREFTEDFYSIVKVGEISPDLLGTHVTVKDVIITFNQDEVYFIPEILANDNPGVDAENMYPIWIHEKTGEFKVDYSNPIPIEPKLLLPLAFAVLIYFQDNAKGVRQNAFLKLFKDKLIELINKEN
jgi:hypothetical protein